MDWVGRDLKDDLVLTPCHGQGDLPLQQLAQSPIQLGMGSPESSVCPLDPLLTATAPLGYACLHNPGFGKCSILTRKRSESVGTVSKVRDAPVSFRLQKWVERKASCASVA